MKLMASEEKRIKAEPTVGMSVYGMRFLKYEN